MNKLKIIICSASLLATISCNTGPIPNDNKQTQNTNPNLEYLKKIKKIDIHTHVRSNQQYLIDFMNANNFKYCAIVTIGSKNNNPLQAQIDTARMLYNKYPRYYGWITSFDASNCFEHGWAERVIEQLNADFNHGAVGVKIWKTVGMEFKRPDGAFLQIDDPVFDPIFEFIANQGKTLITHTGEPIQAWMPTYTTKDGIAKNYWAKHPEFSFWDKPGLPSYNEIMAARDHVLKKHPNLRFVGAHLGSLEFDVDEIASRLELYPNFAVEIGGRTRYFMWQARGKVRDFFIHYQDRIMYGTDMGAAPHMTDEDIREVRNSILYRNDLFLRYYATADDIPWGNIISGDKPIPKPAYMIKGLELPKEILDKVFYKNAVKWFPGIDMDFK